MSENAQMAKTPPALPSFREPPLDEIAIAVQFEEFETLRTVDYGALYELFKADFPVYEEHGRIVARFETFPHVGSPAGGMQLKFEATDRPMLPRAWFVSTDGHSLVQFQPDRLIRNWRKVDGEGVYPRFDAVLPGFQEAYQACDTFLQKSGHGRIAPNQCEVSYFNNLFLNDGQSFGEGFGWFFDDAIRLEIPRAHELGLEPELSKITIVSRIVHEGSPLGRLYVEAVPGAVEERNLIRLQITARGRPSNDTLDDTVAFARLGHDAIVRTFDSIISKRARELWGKQ